MGKLTHLTSLTLCLETNEECLEFFSSLGYSCPQLTTLCLHQIPFGADQFLALVLGNKKNLLPPEFPKDFDGLKDLQFSPESVSPICSSLKELCFYKDQDDKCVPFFLRHFKRLEKMKCCNHKLCIGFNATSNVSSPPRHGNKQRQRLCVRPKRRVLQPIELHEALCYQIRRLQQEQFPSCIITRRPSNGLLPYHQNLVTTVFFVF